MKKKYLIILFLCLGILLPVKNNAQNKVTFKVDMSTIKKTDKVGIRGSLSPLTWDKTTFMKGPDKNGVYSVTVDFGNVKPGTLIKYKFIHGNDVWENEFIGPTANRSFVLPGTNVKMAALKFNEILYFDTDALLESVMQNMFFLKVFNISCANKRGNTCEDVGINYYNFWKGSFAEWVKDPQQLMFEIKVDQAKYPFGEFEIIEDKPGFVKFKFNKAWAVYLEYFGSDGIFKDVTEDEISSYKKIYFMQVAKELNWDIKWEENDKYVLMTINSNI